MAAGNAQDVLLFAQTCFLNNEHHRAIHFLKTSELVLIEDAAAIQEVNLQAILLLGQCMVGKWMLKFILAGGNALLL